MTIVTKVCGDCGVEKDASEFYRQGLHKQYLSAYCKKCTTVRTLHSYHRTKKLSGAKPGPKRRARTPESEKARIARIRRQTRNSNLKKKYGITLAQYEERVADQGGRCLICGRTPDDSLAVDHSHATDQVRGLLCSSCNLGLGHFKDDPQRLIAAAEYLTDSRLNHQNPHGRRSNQ